MTETFRVVIETATSKMVVAREDGSLFHFRHDLATNVRPARAEIVAHGIAIKS